MANEAMKQFFLQGLQALRTAGQQGSDTAAATLQAATHPELKQMLQQGSQAAERHAQRLEAIFKALGEQPSGTDNEIMAGIQAANKRIMQAAPTPEIRDAGIIASSQIALHYYVAAFGTLAAHAKAMGLDEHAATLSGMVDEVTQADQRYTELAERMINPQAARSA